jgi:hypothetical protein
VRRFVVGGTNIVNLSADEPSRPLEWLWRRALQEWS